MPSVAHVRAPSLEIVARSPPRRHGADQHRAVRLSDALGREDLLGGGPLEFVIDEYSTISPFNLGSTRLLLQHESIFALYDGSGHFLGELPQDVHARSEPR